MDRWVPGSVEGNILQPVNVAAVSLLWVHFINGRDVNHGFGVDTGHRLPLIQYLAP